MANSYDTTYQELQCIGRGNFGSAWLVMHKQENQKYVAKKVILEGLGQKEQAGCMMEAGLLKNLNHPNIVAYKESFLGNNHLIIIMEYCDVGDLAFHIKKKQQKNEIFSEQEIFHWFVQICMALEYVHSRKVIHRDIKTQNVFLTGSKTIKVGDFGISKVLESTTQVAMTVVGTPYYMAPESCQSEPYTSKSDVWALGVILFELCTLRQPFQADNLLGLVFKIVQEEPDPIPSHYSPELQDLVRQLMTKNPANRPSTAEILKMPYVRERMQQFVESTEIDNMMAQPVYRKRMPTIRRQNTNRNNEESLGQVDHHIDMNFQPAQNDGTFTSTNTSMPDVAVTLTPAQRMAAKKQEAIRQRQQELHQAAQGAKANYDQARNARQRQTFEGIMGVPGVNHEQYDYRQQEAFVVPAGNPRAQQQHPHNRFSGTGSTMAATNLQVQEMTQDFNNQMNLGGQDEEEDRDDLDFTNAGTQDFQHMQAALQGYNQTHSQAQTMSSDGYRADPNDERPIGGAGARGQAHTQGAFWDQDRPINATGSYDLSQIPLDEIEVQENFSEVEVATMDAGVIDQVKQVYYDILHQATEPFLKKKSIEVEEAQSAAQQKDAIMQQRQTDKDQIREQLGDHRYQDLYDCLVFHRSQPNTNEQEMYADIRQKVGGIKEFLNLAFRLDNIVFHELVLENLNR